MNTLVIQDFTPTEVQMMRMQPQYGVHSFAERTVMVRRKKTAQDVVRQFLNDHPNARIHPTETVRGVPLIIDESRKNLDDIVGFTGIAYPVFAHMYDTVPSEYAFHAVDSYTQTRVVDDAAE